MLARALLATALLAVASIPPAADAVNCNLAVFGKSSTECQVALGAELDCKFYTECCDSRDFASTAPNGSSFSCFTTCDETWECDGQNRRYYLAAILVTVFFLICCCSMCVSLILILFCHFECCCCCKLRKRPEKYWVPVADSKTSIPINNTPGDPNHPNPTYSHV